MTLRMARLDKALAQRNAIKAIAGIANSDLGSIRRVVQAVNRTGVLAVDMMADAELVRAVRAETSCVLFASSIVPAHLRQAVEAGADVAELGNYDALYEEGFFLTADEVFALAREAKNALTGLQARLCVTVPGHLAPWVQVQLARQLETLGVDLLQTEGASRLLSEEPQVAELTPAHKLEITLANTALLQREVQLPIMTASGIKLGVAADAIQHGASAVGVGTALRNLPSVPAMVEWLNKLQLEVDKAAGLITPVSRLPLVAANASR